jgi:hypothetical protein
MLDEARRLASTLEYPRAAWAATTQPVGVLYREEGVSALLSWVTGLAERLRAGAGQPDAGAQIERLHATLYQAAETATPLLRLYEYAEEAPEAIGTIVSARKSFVFWGTDMVEGSSEVLPDMSALWAVGEALDPGSDAPANGSRRAGIESSVAQRARTYERRVRELASDECGAPEIHRLDRLLAQEARLTPRPSATEVISSRAGILWRPRRLELVDVERLRRWLYHITSDVRGGGLAEALAFVDSASREHADLLLDAFCTDSPEAL